MIIHGENILQLFEFDRVLEKVSDFCRTDTSRKLALSLSPLSDRNLAIERLNQTEEFRVVLENKGHFPDFIFDDFLNEANLLAVPGSTLTEAQFSRIRSAVILVNDLLKYLSERPQLFPTIQKLTRNIFPCRDIPEAIDRIIDAHALVRSNASEDLLQIRNRLHSGRRETDRKFRQYINDLRKRGYLRDNEENFYNNRRVLSVPSEYKREVRGIIHGKSDSGRTTFIEPEALVELNNEIAELEQDERIEILRLLRMLTDILRPHAVLIKNYHSFLSHLDLIRAKALFALDINAHLPQIHKHSLVHLCDAVHPLLFLQNRERGQPVVPLNLKLDPENRIMIISGPNAGGKSITLKTVGLMQLMLESGLLVSASEKSGMCFFNHFMADIGDSQSIEYALSTYSSRLIRMNHFIRNANNRTLILIDEFGTGTDPELGGAIAEVVLEELNRRSAYGIFTTHYTNIKLLADRLRGVSNASMLFDPRTLQPKYKLIPGQPGSSYTFEVAEKIGLPEQVLKRAKEKVQQDKLKLNSMLASLHRQKSQAEEDLKTIREKERKADAAIARYEAISDRMTEKMEKDSDTRNRQKKLLELGTRLKNLSEEWGKTKDKKSVIKKFVSSMNALVKKNTEENTPEKIQKKKLALRERLSREIKVGTRVRMLHSKQTGTVEDIRKNTVYVNFGNIRATVNIETLEPVREEENTSPKKSRKDSGKASD
ncbi:MAG: hypothetical protein IT242_07845 [Bacteroidia bacterium]|nr:hypothetical protein [Bacteroidia bacterium]